MPIDPEPLGDSGAFWPVTQPAPRLGCVFVHGWGGEPLTTWAHKPWFGDRLDGLIDYLWKDESLPWRYYSVTHTGAAFQPAGIADVAATVGTFLDTAVFKEVDAVVLVAHSLGGLACRQLIVDRIEDPKRKDLRIIGLLMYGTPNDGTSMARAAGSILGSKSGADMTTYSEPLRKLNERWLQHVTNGGNPDRPIDQRAPILCWNVVGTKDRVVTLASASHMALMGNVYTVTKDHGGLVKPRSSSDLSVGIARDFLAAAKTRSENHRQQIACDRIGTEARERASSAPWIASEQETITLTKLSDAESKAFGDGHQLFRSTVTTVRTKVECRSTLRFGVRLDSVDYGEETKVDFECVVGDGVVENAISLTLRNGAVATDRVGELATVERVAVTHAGTGVGFGAKDVLTQNTGWFVFPYASTVFPTGVDRVDRLEIEMKSIIDVAMGWYTYVTPNTITDGLVVTFRSPFHVACLMPEPLRTQVKTGLGKVVENDRIGGAFVTTVHVDAPVSAKSRINFVFQR